MIGAAVVGLLALARSRTGPISRSFTWAEVYAASRARPPAAVAVNIEALVTTALQPIRDAVGPVVLTSVYRPGNPSSAHATGWAADIGAAIPGATPADRARFVADVLRRAGVVWEEVIAYPPDLGGHVHIALQAPSGAQRSEVLAAYRTADENTAYRAVA